MKCRPPDLAYISAFPAGKPEPLSTSRRADAGAEVIEDLQDGYEEINLRDYDSSDESDDSPMAMLFSTSYSEEAENDVNDENSRKEAASSISRSKSQDTKCISHDGACDSTFKKTKRLQIGILEGTTFLNNYIVVDTLGKGSYGKVKLCFNVADDSLYAVKILDKRMVRISPNISRINIADLRNCIFACIMVLI